MCRSFLRRIGACAWGVLDSVRRVSLTMDSRLCVFGDWILVAQAEKEERQRREQEEQQEQQREERRQATRVEAARRERAR